MFNSEKMRPTLVVCLFFSSLIGCLDTDETDSIHSLKSKGPFGYEGTNYISIEPEHYLVLSGDFSTLEWDIDVENGKKVDVFFMTGPNLLSFVSEGSFDYDDELSALDINSGSKGPIEVTYRTEGVACVPSKVNNLNCPKPIGENEPDRKYIVIDNTGICSKFTIKP